MTDPFKYSHREWRALRQARAVALYAVGFTMEEVGYHEHVSPAYVWKTIRWLEAIADIRIRRSPGNPNFRRRKKPAEVEKSPCDFGSLRAE